MKIFSKVFVLSALIFVAAISATTVHAEQQTQTFNFTDAGIPGYQCVRNGVNYGGAGYCNTQETANQFCKDKGFDSSTGITSQTWGYTTYNDCGIKWTGGAYQVLGINQINDPNCPEWATSFTCTKAVCTSHAATKCFSDTNAVYWIDSCGNKQDLNYQCSASQICQNSQCINKCTSHASEKCVGNAVYWFDSCGTQQELAQACGNNQTCSNAQCLNIACSSNSDCGTNSFVDSPYCQGSSVYQNFKTFTCNNPGTANSTCSNSTSAQQKTTCSGNQTCSNGQCVNQTITCSTDSQCGTNGYINSPVCNGNSVFQDYKTFSCNNPGTGSSYCTNNTVSQKKTTCNATNQTCSNGQCVNQTITCSSNSDCGTSVYTDAPYCGGNNSIWQNFKTYTCANPGTGSSYCTNNTSAQQKSTCSGTQTCSNGNCVDNPNDLSVTCHTTPNPTQINQQVSFIATAIGGTGNYVYSWTGSCTGSTSAACQTSFYQTGSQTATVAVTSGTKTISATCSVDINQTCKPNNSQKCVGNAVYWFDSCGVEGGLVKTCYENQNCSNGSCIDQTIRCSSNSDCGTNVYTDSPYCEAVGNNVWQNFKTFTCNNPGTVASTCTNSINAKIKTTCLGNQTCSGGSCATNQPITCSSNSDCGTSTVSGSPYCGTNNSIYQNHTNPTCLNAGTTSSYCTNPVTPQLINTCSASQTCSSATNTCVNNTYTCSSNADCSSQNGFTGALTCQGNSVYQNYKTYTCSNPGTANSSCVASDANTKKNDCSANQTCTNGSCTNQTIACSSNNDCGTSAYTGAPFCQGNSVYQNYLTYTCSNPGTAASSCVNSTASQLKTTCTGNQTCNNGNCGNTCSYHSYQQCSGNNLYWYDSCGVTQDLIQYCPNGCSNNSCQNNNNNYVTVQTNSATSTYNNSATLNGYLYANNNSNYNNNNYNSCNTYVWFQYGTGTWYGSETSHISQNYSGPFSQNIFNIVSGNATHFRAVAQGCQGNIVYGQDMTIYGQGGGNNLTATKTVRNLTNGSGFATSASAAPGDSLMFMITLQAAGSQDIQNVVVTDNLPTNLIYNNQLVVACSGTNGNNYNNNCSGSNYNYTGSIASGVYLNTIYAGQTVTITYQAQVAPAQNFSYGTTTLNNSASITSSSGSNPTISAQVMVTRTAVYGASSVSTGLTNNFWADSFFLPLAITLLLLWMWQSGMFIGMEKWLTNKKKNLRGYKAEKELANRIASIQKIERA